MPFTEAVLAEVMRWKTIIPLNLMRYTLEDTELRGYFIPKHTHVLGILWAIDHDERIWGYDVHVFKPERFLSKDGKKIVKPEYAAPFSVGKRDCPGKSLAQIEVFLYVVAIFQKFMVQAPKGSNIDFESLLGLSQTPKRQDLCFKQRSTV
ncbi:unnamed protein product [Larinioides sclopetarius]